MKGAVKYLAYLGAGLFFFIFFLFATFPYEVLQTRIINQTEDNLGGQYRIKVQKMGGGLLTGFRFKNVEIVKKEEGKETLLFKTPLLKISPSLSSLIGGYTQISYDIDTTKGSVSGRYYENTDQSEVILSFDELNLEDLKFLSALYELNLKGVLDGDLNFKLSKKDPSKNSGKINLKLVNWVLDPIKIKLDPQSPESAIELPKITLTNAKNSKIIGEINKGDLDIKDFSLSGGDLDLSLKGKIGLAPMIDDYRINLDGHFKLGSNLSQGIPLLALFEQQKEADGSYALQLSGKLTKPAVMIGKFKLPF